MAVTVLLLEYPTLADEEKMRNWLIDNVGPLNPARPGSTNARWGMNWWMKAIMARGVLKWQVGVPDDNTAVMFRLACS